MKGILVEHEVIWNAGLAESFIAIVPILPKSSLELFPLMKSIMMYQRNNYTFEPSIAFGYQQRT